MNNSSLLHNLINLLGQHIFSQVNKQAGTHTNCKQAAMVSICYLEEKTKEYCQIAAQTVHCKCPSQLTVGVLVAAL